jgi:hypothetical protein
VWRASFNEASATCRRRSQFCRAPAARFVAL